MVVPSTSGVVPKGKMSLLLGSPLLDTDLESGSLAKEVIIIYNGMIQETSKRGASSREASHT